MTYKVLYWNTRTKSKLTHLALWNSSGADVVAIQEPHIGKTQASACSSRANYGLIYTSGKAAMYIHKRHDPGSWTPDGGENWCSVTFLRDRLIIYSIYNPNGATPQSSPLLAIRDPGPGERVVLTGDFDLHHPMWDHFERLSRYSGLLLDLAQRLNLGLVTPKGECTRFSKGQRNSTIDLAWASQGLPVRYCSQDKPMGGSDHIPQLISVELGDGPTEGETFFRWRQIDKELAGAEARIRFLPQSPPTTASEIDSKVDELITHLQQIANVSVPKRPRSYKQHAEWWTPGVKQAEQAVKKARRKYRARPDSDPLWESLRETIKAQDRVIGKAQRASWREFTERASNDSSTLWKLERGARLRSGLPPEPAHLPNLKHDQEGRPIAKTHEEKTRALAERFFPTSESDRTHIQHQDFPNESFQDPMPNFGRIEESEVGAAIHRAGSWSAPGPDGIPSGLLKACGQPPYIKAVLSDPSQHRPRVLPSPFSLRYSRSYPKAEQDSPTEAKGWRVEAHLAT